MPFDRIFLDELSARNDIVEIVSQYVQLKKSGASRVLVVYGGHSAKKSGLLDRVLALLGGAGVSYDTLGGVQPNPHLGLAREGVKKAIAMDAQLILAIGGGSVIDSAKAIGYGLCMDGDVWDLYDHTRKAEGCTPIGVVLTIAASGSEMSNSSVITKEEGGVKRGYNDEICRPKFAIMNPELTMTLPDYQTACGCADILMHTMERYFTQGDSLEITDSIAEGLLRTVMAQAVILRDDPKNYDARAEVMWAGSLSHNGLTGCGHSESDFASHRLEHELGGMFDVAHGAGLTAVWGSWARYVYKNCLPRFVRFARNVMGVEAGLSDEETALRGIENMEDFFCSIRMPTSLSELGVHPTEAQLCELARKCKIAVGGLLGSARRLDESDMLAIYKMANH